MDNLGIEIIYANSPQAKGRVERANKTLQDRLTKERRLAGISDIGTANAFLPEFIKKYNQKFAVEPKSKSDAHRQLQLSDEELNLVFSTHSTRTLSKNLELSYNNVVYQIQVFGQGYALRHAKILVCEDLSGNVSLLYKSKKLNYKCYRKQKHNGNIVDEKSINKKVDEFIRKSLWRNHDRRLLQTVPVAILPATVPTG